MHKHNVTELQIVVLELPSFGTCAEGRYIGDIESTLLNIIHILYYIYISI